MSDDLQLSNSTNLPDQKGERGGILPNLRERRAVRRCRGMSPLSREAKQREKEVQTAPRGPGRVEYSKSVGEERGW